MLIGFTIVAAPLLFAIVNAAVQMNHLSNRSEQLVIHGMQGTRNNQSMFEEIGALERTARLYQIIGNSELLEVYTRNHGRLVATINELLTLPIDTQSQADARKLLAEADRLLRELKAAPPNSVRMAEIINAFPRVSDMASNVSNLISTQIDRELTSLQLEAQRAQQKLLWQTHQGHRPRHQRAGPRYVLQTHLHQRTGRFGTPGNAVGVAANETAGIGAGEESVPETHVA
jgi:two-component system sensor histidine kinase GlrK